MNAAFKTDAGRDAVLKAYGALLDAWPHAHERITVPTREGDTFVLVCGPKHAPPLVLFHGAQANASAYLMDATLWSQRFRVYAVDMIGEAGFSAPSRPPLGSEAHALWLDDVFAALGLQTMSLVGTSLGGWLALDYASRRPGRVNALALLCPAGIGAQKNLLLKILPLLFLGAWGKRRIGEMIFGKAMTADDAVSPLHRQFIAMMDLLTANIRPRIVRIPRLTDQQLAALPPTLVIIGGKDVLLDSADTKRRLEAHAPRATVRFLPEARHFIPDQANTMLGFLQSHAASVTAA